MVSKKDEEKKTINVFENALVPKQEILSGDARAELLKNLGVAPAQLPKMLSDDAIVKILGAKRGDIIRIERKFRGNIYYRVVI